ncbi:beta-alanine-activating enzyme isoform X2 [Ambystoma mexicanum]|uniref:beta-alanine-activating enzyme isoform X2 n=1 Tax=Ambystoma mexicanum TaxID=8296 RepID=UPI0037E82F15
MTLHELVQKAAALYANRRAVCFDDCNIHDPHSYTYNEVVQFAEELAHFLRKHCDPAENCEIGLYCNHGINLPSWILGILLVPAAYSPIDPDVPSNVSSCFIERLYLKYILVQNEKVQEFKASYSSLLHEQDYVSGPLGVTLFKLQWNASSGSLLVDVTEGNGNRHRVKTHFEHEEKELLKGSEKFELQNSFKHKHRLAYALHTSGTTGTPKIVRVPHECIVPNIHHLRSIFNITEHDVLFLASPLTFDPSVVEMFSALSSGACLLIVPNTVKMMPQKLCETLFHRHKLTVLQATPTLLRTLGTQYIRSSVLSANSSLRVLALGGEAFPALSVFKKWRDEGNQTHIYNLYGVTEVSCWATCYRVPHEVFSRKESPIPLGSPLLGTVVEVRDPNGSIVEEGEGQLFLGGKERICFLDAETSVNSGKMRETGDWVSVIDTNILFLGRKDNQIKRHGKRLCIEYVQQVIEGFCEVETCAIIWYKEEKLVLFVVPKGSIDKNSMFAKLQKHLSSYAFPDDILEIKALPLTSHGKTDTSELNKIYKNHLGSRVCGSQLNDVEKLWDTLQLIWKSVLGSVDTSTIVAKESVFLYCGGDSLKSLRFQEEVENLVGKNIPGLLEVVLNNTFSDIYTHVAKAQFQNKNQASSINGRSAKRKHSANNGEDFDKYAKQSHSQEHLPSLTETYFTSVSRGNVVYKNNASLFEPNHNIEQAGPEAGRTSSYSLIAYHNANNDTITTIAPETTRVSAGNADVTVQHGIKTAGELRLELRWKSDTGKCVDASPLVIMSVSDESSGTIYIGSHSHRMKALDLSTGKVMWEMLLGDRLESSACVSKCGAFIIVGCYDGTVYFLRRWNGETYWTFTTDNAVKSSPTVDPTTGIVFIGSHDQHAYAFNVDDNGSIIWEFSCEKPLFSSPRCSQDGVYIGCVDDNVYCFSHYGETKWKFATNGPVFSTPSISRLAGQEVHFGSHDGNVYCCNALGNLLWVFQTTSKVYATPFIFCGHDESLVAAASTDGTLWILAAESGLLRTTYRLPGEVFSSPVVCGTKIVVGCRNDYVYCLDVCPGERKNSNH